MDTRYLAAALALAPSLAAMAQTATFSAFGDWPGGGQGSNTRGVSADGLIVVGIANDSEGPRGFRWTVSTGMVSIGTLPGATGSAVTCVSGDGSVIVGAVYPRGVRWMQGSGLVPLPSPLGSVSDLPLAVSFDGTAVVGHTYFGPGTENLAWRWTTAGGVQLLSNLPFYGVGVSGDGATVLLQHGADGIYLWTPTTGVRWVAPLSRPIALSADGTTVVGADVPGCGAFRWRAATGYDCLGTIIIGGNCTAYAVSADGSVVVGGCVSPTLPALSKAFIWDQANGMRDLQALLATSYGATVPGLQLWEATGVSADGTVIVGNAYNSCGWLEGWRVALGVPPPCYANCDGSTIAPVLNINDFACFLNRFAAGDNYANCDGSCADPVLNVNDFACYLNKFAAGCP